MQVEVKFIQMISLVMYDFICATQIIYIHFACNYVVYSNYQPKSFQRSKLLYAYDMMQAGVGCAAWAG